jgi:hypothetical protein
LIAYYLLGLTKARLHANSKPSVKFFDIKNRFFSKSDIKFKENPDDDEDDSWLDEPNLETFVPELSLAGSQAVNLSSDCLATVLSEEPSGNASEAAPNLPEALGEPSELDEDFSMEL